MHQLVHLTICWKLKTVWGEGGASPVAQPQRTHLQCRRHGLDPWVGKIPRKEGMATHSSILAWRIPWMEEPGWRQPMGSQRVRHDRATKPTRTHSSKWLWNRPGGFGAFLVNLGLYTSLMFLQLSWLSFISPWGLTFLFHLFTVIRLLI